MWEDTLDSVISSKHVDLFIGWSVRFFTIV